MQFNFMSVLVIICLSLPFGLISLLAQPEPADSAPTHVEDHRGSGR